MYSVDYYQKEIETLSPDKRDPSIIAFNKPAVIDIQNLHDNLFFTYKQFQALPQWAAGTYAEKANVIYKKAVYESLISGNTEEPTFGTNWELISPNFLGSDMRLKIRGEKLVFENAINTWFSTIFRQPPALSDIYILNNAANSQSPFIVGESEPVSSIVGPAEGSYFVGLDYSFAAKYNFSIKVPVAVYTALGSSVAERDSIIREFADKYVPCGINYIIETY